MRTLLFIALALLAFAYVASASYANQDPLRLFSEFKDRYSKAYPSPAEHNTRLLIFQQNMQHVDELNRIHNTDAFTIETPFADLSPQEFKDAYLMKEDEVRGFIQDFNALPQWNDAHLDYANNTVGAVSSFDWRNSGIVTPVKDQKQCGSCWAFAATEVLESVWARYGNPLPVLAPQQLVDCTYSGRSGCNGGWPSDGWNYLKTAGGQTYESNYPYKGSYQGSCLYRGGQGVAKVSQSISVSSGNENALYNYVTSTSPVAIAVDATNFQYYKAGTIFPASSCTTNINHAVVVTGYQNLNGQDVWNIRNSWNTWWGNQGYLYLPMWQNACTVSTYGLGVK